jgi:hypothetical protein
MANGEGLTIDGNGSVRWSAVTVDDDTRKSEAIPHGKVGRRSKGADKLHGEYFKVEIQVPADATREAFLSQFRAKPTRAEYGEAIVLYLRILPVDGQIVVHWTPGIAPPQGPGQTGSTPTGR